MATVVDARGLACPQPVIETRKAMQDADQVVTLVDNETSLTNVSRMAAKAGWQVGVAEEGDEYRIALRRTASLAETQPLPVGKAELTSGPLVLVVSSDQMGQGDAELGSRGIIIAGQVGSHVGIYV